jgi:putative long chain acyl-CoA synthase
MPAPLDRLVRTAVNGVEVLRHGGLRVEARPSPFEVVGAGPVFRLRRYFPGEPTGRPPVLLVPPLMQVAEVWDISPDTSAVAMLHAQGVDPWVIDFGDPDQEPDGDKRDFADHVLAVSEAVEHVRAATGHDVHLGGYSQGGIFCYGAAAYRACDGVASVFVLGSPLEALDFEQVLPEKLIWEIADLQRRVFKHNRLPRWAVRQMFNWSSPQRTIRGNLEFLLALHDREALLPREPQRQFLKRNAWVAWSGPAMSDVIDILRDDRMMKGGLVIGHRAVGLSDVTCPVLVFIGESDQFGPGPLVRQIVKAAPKAEVYECTLPVGHFGLPVSSHARTQTWPGVGAWVRWCADETPLPDYIRPLSTGDIEEQRPRLRSTTTNLTYGLGQAAAYTAFTAPRIVAQTGQRAASTARELSREAIAQMPRLARLESMGPGTRISYGAMLDESARRKPNDVAFVFEDRAHTHAAAKRRIDDVVRGLIALGIRRGEHIGVLMGTRPSALVIVAALNRLGAVAVLLRPGEETDREVRLGHVTRIISDPDHADAALGAGVDVSVLGGGPDRALPDGTLDMEQIDPHTVEPPAWYTPNPGRAQDVAFILFSGSGSSTRADRITNGRWARSALVASAAAALQPDDTVYSVSPLHHPSGLLLTTAAAAAGGARLAMSSRFDPATFWSEVRRYGVTVVPYTWTMLHELLAGAPHPEEQGHPIRLFIGSGMPPSLWERVTQRLSPASVLELYASTRTGAIVGNASGRKVGAMGRALPGTPRVSVAQCDPTTGKLREGADGLAVECDPGETGLLLVEAESWTAGGNDIALQGVFTNDDAWFSTGDLVRTDEAGDLWFVDSVAALIATERGIVSPRQVETALGVIPAVDLAACYPVALDGTTVAVVAVTLQPDTRLDTAAIGRALATLEHEARPDVVHVVGALPMTSWFRPSIPDLQAAGVPDGQDGRARWRLDPRTGRYRAMKKTPHPPVTQAKPESMTPGDPAS